jgi:hypothetical protein
MTDLYRTVLSCKGIPPELGPSAARDISEEFVYRPWHRNVTCRWEGGQLILQADNDYDPAGLALRDEFSDAISATVPGVFDRQIDIIRSMVVSAGTPNAKSASEQPDR